MAGRCVQGLIDVLERNYGGDITKMPYALNKEAFCTSSLCLCALCEFCELCG